jgi:hypothetical protein
MVFRLFVIAVIAGFILSSCTGKSSKAPISEVFLTPPDEYPKGYKPDSSDLYVDLKFDINIRYMKFVFPESSKAVELNKAEMKSIDSLITVSVKLYNQESKKKGWGEISDLKNYRRQLVAVIDTNGVKQVYVNAFTMWPGFETSWKKRLSYVSDGGSGYFHLFINLKKRKYYHFGVNGMA